MATWVIFRGQAGFGVFPKSRTKGFVNDNAIIHEFEANGFIKAHDYKLKYLKENGYGENNK